METGIVRPDFFIFLFTNPATVIFRKVEKKYFKIILLFYPPTLNIICLVEKKTFFRFCLCIFDSDTVKVLSCPDF